MTERSVIGVRDAFGQNEAFARSPTEPRPFIASRSKGRSFIAPESAQAMSDFENVIGLAA
jgi:hypothetical protein